MRRHVLLVLAVVASGCTAVDYAVLPTQAHRGEVFISMSGLNEPYESVGLVQITRRGVRAFGFADPAGTDLTAAATELAPEIRRAGADGVINAKFTASPVTTLAKIMGLIFFFAPIPAEVTVTGELVKLRAAAGPAAPAVPGANQGGAAL